MSSSNGLTSLALGSLLREYREWAGYSRQVLAERFGISTDQLGCWEILGVPVPFSDRFIALAEFLDIAESAVAEALVERPKGDGAAGPARYLPRDPMEVYKAAPVLEDAIAVHGLTPEEIAEALATSPTKVQSWRLGVIEMTDAEGLMLSGLVRLRNEPAHE
jgi:transcriptional regulator with XRE-family HTH domain